MWNDIKEYRLTFSVWQREYDKTYEIKQKRKTARFTTSIAPVLQNELEEQILDYLIFAIKDISPIKFNEKESGDNDRP